MKCKQLSSYYVYLCNLIGELRSRLQLHPLPAECRRLIAMHSINSDRSPADIALERHQPRIAVTVSTSWKISDFFIPYLCQLFPAMMWGKL